MTLQKARTIAAPLFKGLVLVVIFAVILNAIDTGAAVRLLGRTAPVPFAAAVLLFLANRFLSALKWKMILRSGGVNFPYPGLVRIIFESSLLGILVPSGFGTDFIRLLQMQRKGESLSAVTGSVLADRSLGVMAIAALVALAVPLSWPLIENKLLLTAVLCFGGGAVLAVFFLMSNVAFGLYGRLHRRAFRLAGALLSAPEKTAALSERLLGGAGKVHASFGAIRSNAVLFGAVVAVNVVFQVFRVFQVHFLFRALGAAPPLAVEMAFVPIILILILMPFSPYLGLGVKEAAFIYFFSLAGIAREISFSVSILSHLVILVGLIPAVFLFLAGRSGSARPGGEVAT